MIPAIGVLLAPAPAVADVTVSFDPLDSTISASCQTALVAVTVDDQATDLKGFTLTFNYDPAVVAPVAVTPGELLTGLSCGYFFQWLDEGGPNDGTIQIDAAALSPCTMVGPGSIILTEWEPVGNGVTSVACVDSVSILRDSNNVTIPHVCEIGSITVQALPPPTVTVSYTPIESVIPAIGFTAPVLVTIDDQAIDVRAFMLSFSYDPAIVEPISVTPGDLLTGLSCGFTFDWVDEGMPSDGLIEVVGSANSPCTMTGPGTIIATVWRGLAAGTSPLVCATGSLSNSCMDTVPHVCDTGSIIVETGVPVESVHWSRIKSLFR